MPFEDALFGTDRAHNSWSEPCIMMLTAIPCLGVPPVLRAQLATVGANMPQLEQLQAQVDADFLTSPPPSSSTTGSPESRLGFTINWGFQNSAK